MRIVCEDDDSGNSLKKSLTQSRKGSKNEMHFFSSTLRLAREPFSSPIRLCKPALRLYSCELRLGEER